MATAERRFWDRSETQKKIRHPLQALSGHIRRYILLEGLAVAILFLAICFWIWLLIDFGTFSLFGLDAVKWLDRTYPPETAFFIRAFVLALVVAGLLAVVIIKVLRRLFTEFTDSALALVLERRFPRQLGDRLITAVEMADPKLADKYGYSQEMVDYTIRAAAERVAQVPVTEVFNWRRLGRQWSLVALCTLGVYFVLFAGFGTWLAVAGESPGDYFWRFNRNASIWAKRNALVQQRVYWPTQSYVEFVRFQVSGVREDGTEVMKVARDEKRPDIEVRAFEWVIYDPRSEDSVRPLKLADLKGWVDDGLLNIPLDPNWPHWIMDTDDLDPAVPASIIADNWTGKTAGYIRQDMKDQHPGLLDWLNWQTWTVDQLQAQLDKVAVERLLREKHKEALERIEGLLGQLEELSVSPAANWNIRKLTLPSQIQVTYLGKQTRSYRSFQRQEDNRFYVSLSDLKEDVSLTIYAEDFYTAPKVIELVPPPRFSRLEIHLEEPAYKYYRLQGSQDPLKGARHRSVKLLSLTGPSSQYEVLAGTSIKMVAMSERELRDEISIEPPQLRKAKDSDLPGNFKKVEQNGKVFWRSADGKAYGLMPDKKTIWLEVPSLQKAFEFEFRFVDQDNVKGSRHVLLRAAPDQAPEEVEKLALAAPLRTPATGAEEGSGIPAAGLKGFFITPDAHVPFHGLMQDDIGLAKMEWVYDYEVVQFSLFRTEEPGEDIGAALKRRLELIRRAQLFTTGFQGLPLVSPQAIAGPVYWQMISELIEKDIDLTAQADKKRDIIKGVPAPMINFHAKLEQTDRNKGLSGGEFLTKLQKNQLTGDPPKQILPKAHQLDTFERFDVQKVLGAAFKPKGDAVQKHFRLRVWMSATDNNLETGPGTTLSKEPITFLIISPSELRALILLQEDKIRSDLEKARDKLDKDVRVTIYDQIDKFRSNPKQDLTLVRLRVENDIRKHLEKTTKAVAQALGDYNKIYQELEVNRMDESYMSRVLKKIITPLEEITTAKTGEIARTLDMAHKLHFELELDEEAFRAEQGKDLEIPQPIRDKHIANLLKTQEELDALIKKLNGIIEAIGGEFGVAQAQALLQAIVEDQDRQTDELRVIHKKAKEDLEKLLLD